MAKQRTLVFTQPVATAGRLLQALCEYVGGAQQLQVNTIFAAMLHNQPLQQTVGKYHAAIDAVIVTSPASAQWFAAQLPSIADWYAVGQSTAATLQARGIAAHCPQEWGGDGVLRMLRQHHADKLNVLLVQGRHARPLLRQQLQKLGHTVTVCEVYTTHTYSYSTAFKHHVAAALTADDLVVFSSIIALENWDNWMTHTNYTLAVTSSRIASIAAQLGYTAVVLIGSSNHQNICKVVAGFLCVGLSIMECIAPIKSNDNASTLKGEGL